MSFGLQNSVVHKTPTGRIDSAFPAGNDGSDVQPSWNTNLPDLTTLQVGTPFSIDLVASSIFTDPGSPASELGFNFVSGTPAAAAGFSLSGTVLSTSCAVAVFGTFRLVAVRNGKSVLSNPISYAVNAAAGIDNVAPTTPTGIKVAQGSVVNTIALTCDTPCDVAPPGLAAAGSARVDVLVNGSVASPPSPLVTAANALASPVGANIGSITSPSVPAFAQSGKVWTLTAAGTGIASTSSEQCLYMDFGTYSGAQKFIAQLDPYTSGSATALSGLMLHETGVAGGRFLAVGLRPSNGTVGLYVIGRATAAAASTQLTSLVNDGNGHAITGPVYIKIERAADNKTWTLSYSLDENGWTVFSTQTLTMNAAVHAGLFITSQSAGNAVTALIEEVAITAGSGSLSATIPATSAVNIQLRSVDSQGNVSDLSPIIVGVPKPPVVNGGSLTKLLLGNGFWFDNQYWPGNQQNLYNAQINSLLADPTIKYIWLSFTWAAMEDAVRGNYTGIFGIVDTVLAKLRTAPNGRKVGLCIELWQTFFNTNNTSRASDWPAYVIANNWVQAFIDLNGTQRTQLKFDIDDIWTALTDMFKAIGARYDSDPNFYLLQLFDESVAVDVTQNAGTVINATHYNTKFKQMCLDVKAVMPHTLVGVPFNFLPPGGNAQIATICDMITTFRQQYPGGFLFGGPDPMTNRNVHNNPGGAFITTFQNIISGRIGTVGDLRGTVALKSQIQEFLLGNSGSPPTAPPITPTQLYSDAVDVGKCQVLIWNYETWEYYKAADELAAIHARNGITAAVPSEGNFDTTGS